MKLADTIRIYADRQIEDAHHLADVKTFEAIKQAHPDWTDAEIADEMSKAEDGEGPFKKLRQEAGPKRMA